MTKNITIVGCGYVGMSLGVLLTKNHNVTFFDKDLSKVKKISNNESTIKDSLIDDFIRDNNLDLLSTNCEKDAFNNAQIVIVAISVDYDQKTKSFDTSKLDKLLENILTINKNITIVIKSTLPVGYVEYSKEKFSHKRIYFSPEFLREGNAINDNLRPSRLVIGSEDEHAKEFISILKEISENKDVPVIYTSSEEAEAIKLFANSYLAMRVSFFNELDSFAISKNLSAKKIIQGISLDERIGAFYNNPSFGYGGYCLPKDSKQLSHELREIPSKLIDSIIESNESRKNFIASTILKDFKGVVGVYKLSMKLGSDNFRESAILDIIEKIQDVVEVIIYDESVSDEEYSGARIERDFNKFIAESDIVIANRYEDELSKYREKVFTRDIFNYL